MILVRTQRVFLMAVYYELIISGLSPDFTLLRKLSPMMLQKEVAHSGISRRFGFAYAHGSFSPWYSMN